MGAWLHLIRDRKPLPGSISPATDHARAAVHYTGLLSQVRGLIGKRRAAVLQALSHLHLAERESARQDAVLPTIEGHMRLAHVVLAGAIEPPDPGPGEAPYTVLTLTVDGVEYLCACGNCPEWGAAAHHVLIGTTWAPVGDVLAPALAEALDALAERAQADAEMQRRQGLRDIACHGRTED